MQPHANHPAALQLLRELLAHDEFFAATQGQRTLPVSRVAVEYPPILHFESLGHCCGTGSRLLPYCEEATRVTNGTGGKECWLICATRFGN